MANQKRRKHMKDHNYLKKILGAKESLKPGTITIANVAHDDWCSLYSGKGKECDCNPEITYQTVTAEDEEEKA